MRSLFKGHNSSLPSINPTLQQSNNTNTNRGKKSCLFKSSGVHESVLAKYPKNLNKQKKVKTTRGLPKSLHAD